MIGFDTGLSIDLHIAAANSHRTRISSSRPLTLSRLFVGKTPDELVASLPRLYSVCGVAQACVVRRACANALGIEIEPERRAAQDRLVAAEMLREHVLRILVGWTRQLGQPAASGTARLVTGFVGELRRALFHDEEAFAFCHAPMSDETLAARQVARVTEALECEIFAESLDMFTSRSSLEALDGWATGAGTPAAHLVRCVLTKGWAGEGASDITRLGNDDDTRLAERLAADDADSFIARPTLDGLARETSALTRHEAHPLLAAVIGHYGRGLLARLVARLVEIASLPAQLAPAMPTAPAKVATETGRGLAAIETARGRLVHYVEILAGRIHRFRILAPTEWNFHPEGAVATSLAALTPGPVDGMRRRAELLIETIDPCVGYDLRLHHA